MKVCNSRKWTTSVMAHRGFGELTITKGNINIVIPETCINQTTGLIKKSVQAKIEKLDVQNINYLMDNNAKRIVINID